MVQCIINACFLGNFTTTFIVCRKLIVHCISGEVKDIRILTKESDNSPKGCAYVEFYTEKAHKVCYVYFPGILSGGKSLKHHK